MLGAVARHAGSVRVLYEAGVIRPIRPDKLARAGLTVARWGRGHAAGCISSAILSPRSTAIIDETGTLTFAQVDSRTNCLAHSLSGAGVREGDAVAIMCRNHRGFVEATVAAGKLGAHSLYLNTAFAGPQLVEVVGREAPVAIVYDEEFAPVLDGVGGCRRFVVPAVGELIAAGSAARPPPPRTPGRAILLTSGTTGAPQGVSRPMPASLQPAVALLSEIPLRAQRVTHVAAPLFHSWGLAHLALATLLGSTLSLARRFDAEECLAAVERTRADALVVVPVMMQRILELRSEARRRYDTSSLRVVASSGAPLPGDLAGRWMDEFGDCFYNLYGSTEVAWATIATPADLRAAPGTAGRAPRGTVVRLYDEQRREVPAGATGRVFVGNEMLFEGYTGGGSKDLIDGLMASGDVGRMDAAGRLFVEGRDDEMIVSGGENVFPQEVEHLLAAHPDVVEAAAVGVPDERFGQRLHAFVVCRDPPGPSAEELKRYVRDNLATFKVPGEISFVTELPRNSTGKVLKRELGGGGRRSALSPPSG